MPDVSLRSTFIVGFPGEEEDDFELLLDFIREAGFHHAGAFLFSREEDTPAASLTSRVPPRVARARLRRVSAVLQSESEAALQGLLGSRQEVLVDALVQDDEEYADALGRTRGQAPEIDGVTYLTGCADRELKVGMSLRATITDVIGLDLVARVDET
jgi:ribosomal protein S12 methylthiotransferase